MRSSFARSNHPAELWARAEERGELELRTPKLGVQHGVSCDNANHNANHNGNHKAEFAYRHTHGLELLGSSRLPLLLLANSPKKSSSTHERSVISHCLDSDCRRMSVTLAAKRHPLNDPEMILNFIEPSDATGECFSDSERSLRRSKLIFFFFQS